MSVPQHVYLSKYGITLFRLRLVFKHICIYNLFIILFCLSPGMDEESDCVACDGGYYCAYAGQPNVTAECSEGYYCAGNASRHDPDGKNTRVFDIIMIISNE